MRFPFKIVELDLPVLNKNQENVSGQPIWHPVLPRMTLHKEYSNYHNLIFRGIVPSGSNIKSNLPYARNTHPLASKIGLSNLGKLKQIAGDKFYLAIPTVDNINFSVATYEARPPCSYHDIYHSKAFDFINNEYGSLLKDSMLTSEQVWEYIDLSKSPGYPANARGFPNKRSLLTYPPFTQYLFENKHINTRPIWCVHPKEEFKELEDLKKNKIRLFTIPPLDLLYEQVRFSKRSAERLKLFKWSAYGFNPYRGGTNNMAQKLLKYRIRLFYDISGWDKFLPILCELYERFIEPNSNIHPSDLDNYMWMAFNTYNFMFKTPQGHVFLKKYGNPSGSGATTRDNIFAHIVILASALIECYYNKFKLYPAYAWLSDQVVFLFGDDNIMSLHDDFSLILENDFLFKHFEKYGMKLKFLHGGIDFPIEQMQFLGFYFQEQEGIYIPRYDIERLCTSAVYSNGRDRSREAFTSRLFILMIMSYPTKEVFPYFRSAFNEWASFLFTIYEVLTPTEKAFYDMASITDDAIFGLYNGYESSVDFSFFLSTQRMEDGINYSWLTQEFQKLIDY